MFDHPLFTAVNGYIERDGDRPQYGGDIFSLLATLECDSTDPSDVAQQTVSFFFFDFDDTLHLTAPATKELYHEKCDANAMAHIRDVLAAEGVFFNAHDPPPHPHIGRFLRHLKSRYQNVLLLTAGSAAQILPSLPSSSSSLLSSPPFCILPCSLHGAPPGEAAVIELTLFSNYVSLWRAAYGDDLFSYFGTDERLLPLSQVSNVRFSIFSRESLPL